MGARLFVRFLALSLITGSLGAIALHAESGVLLNERIEAIAKDGIDVVAVTNGGTEGAHEHISVSDYSLQQRLAKQNTGDRISLIYDLSDGKKELRLFSVLEVEPAPTPTQRLEVLAGAALICFLLYFLLSGLHPSRLIIGDDGRYSNSKFQIALWFFVMLTTYLATLWFRAHWTNWEFIGGINIPSNLLLISGISAVTYGAAKGITVSKVAEAQAKGIADPKNSLIALRGIAGALNPPAPVKPNFFLNLTHNDGKSSPTGQPQLDLGDFQMIMVTLLAVAVYFALVFKFLGTIEKVSLVTLPDVDTTILATFGIGHGAYLTKKAVGNVGDS